MADGPHQGQTVVRAGTAVEEAEAAVIAVHGRGATAPSILQLAEEIGQANMAYVAPQAAGNTWYSYSFLEQMERNEPGLSSGLQAIDDVVSELERGGIPAEKIVLMGFSQGACLASEYVARHAQRYGGLVVFSGGVIGPEGTPRDYEGSLDGTPIFIGCSDVDAHIPLQRVHETAAVMEALGGDVDKRIYAGMGHNINQDELEAARDLISKVAG